MAFADFEFCSKSHSINITGNKFNLETLSKFSNIIEDIEKIKDIKCINLFGDFNSDFNFKDIIGVNKDKNNLKKSLILLQSITKKIEDSPVNFSCHLNGLVKGPALELALSCNSIKSEESTSFLFNEIDNGLILIFGSIQRLLRNIGYKNTLELLLFKKKLTYLEALDFKMINTQKYNHSKIKGSHVFWDQDFTNTFIYYNSKVHAKTKNILPAYNAILSSIFEGCLCGYEASLSIERKWVQWLLNHEYTLEKINRSSI